MNTDTQDFIISGHLTTIRRGVMDYAQKSDTYISEAEKAARELIGDDALIELGEARKALPARAYDEDGFTSGNAVIKDRMQTLAEEAAK